MTERIPTSKGDEVVESYLSGWAAQRQMASCPLPRAGNDAVVFGGGFLLAVGPTAKAGGGPL